MGNILEFVRSPFCTIYSDAFIYSLVSKRRKHLWLIAAPKSGSTWLGVIIKNLLKWDTSALVSGYDRNEQEVDIRKLVTANRHRNIFSVHQHCKASKPTIGFIQNANIKPLIHIRNIFDTVVSVRDHIQNETSIIPTAYMDRVNWMRLSGEQKLNFVIDMVVPWYLSFYSGWFSNEIVKNGTAYISTYESLKSDPYGTVKKICEWVNEEVTESQIKEALELAQKSYTRKNKGEVGRGAQYITGDQKEKIINMCRYYPNINFEMIGIHNG